MSLYVFGDVHFSSLQPWRLPLGDAFLAWLENFEISTNSSAMFLGDYCDGAVLPGREISQLSRLAKLTKSKFKEVYFLVGNHDLKLWKNAPQLSFEFVEQEGITILREPAETLYVEGMNILSLPHYNYRTDIPSMWDYYAHLPKGISEQHYDLVVGHFSDTSAMLFDHLIDVSYLDADHVALGHQHIRSSAHYTGSLYPCKISENDSPQPRAVWVYEKTGTAKATKKEVVMPRFGEYRAVEYPKPLPAKKADITIYTVLGCESEKIAREFYGKDIFIRGVAQNFVKKENNDLVVTDDAFTMDNPVEIFNEWRKGVKTPLSRSVVALVQKMLTPPA